MQKGFNSLFLVLLVAFAALAVFVTNNSSGDSLLASAGKGYDSYGYNNTARIFNGTGSSWCLAGGQPADCMGAYSQDKLVMKWNEAWDACNDAGNDDETACAGAWINNEWNGKNGGTGSVWHYKIIWVGSQGESSPYWKEGGYSVWGNYEAIMDQGVDPSMEPMHSWFAKAKPNGYGAK